MKIPIVERTESIYLKGKPQANLLKCDTDSISGSISQRACVYCGARVVLNPITDALHLVHGPIGCASYTWDIRGSLSSGSELYRNSFSTDLKEQDVIFGGEKKLALAIDDLVEKYHPPVIFVYSTCIIGVIGDDLEAVCRIKAHEHQIEIIPIQSSGFIGNKAAGYRAACEGLLRLINPGANNKLIQRKNCINLLGDFNLAAETWIIKGYLAKIGIELNVTFTGDSTYQDLKKATVGSLNIVQCAGSMIYLANKLLEQYDIPFIPISFIGMEDTIASLRKIALTLNDPIIMQKTEHLIQEETAKILPVIKYYRNKLQRKKAAVYVGGGFKAISLIKQLKELGIDVVMIGTQTGRKEDYEVINALVDDGTVVLDDANPSELETFMIEKGAQILIGGVKERPLAYKLGVAFIDHNHDRKHPLSGFVGVKNFAEEVFATVCSPVWKYV